MSNATPAHLQYIETKTFDEIRLGVSVSLKRNLTKPDIGSVRDGN